MTQVKYKAAIEEFTEQVNSEITADQPVTASAEVPADEVEFSEDSANIDLDLEQITKAAQGLEDIISLVEEEPGEETAPLAPFTEKAVNLALESNDIVGETGNPLEGGNATKGQALEKIKEFAKKVWAMLRDFGKKIAEWIRTVWAKQTERLMKNKALAEKVLSELDSLKTDPNAKITDKALLAKIATASGTSIGDVLMSVTEHAKFQGDKGADALTVKARACIDAVVSGASNVDGVLDDFLAAMATAAGEFDSEATAEQAATIKAAAQTKVLLSAPFFNGYRAWVAIPEASDNLQAWNHGVSKVDTVKPAESVDAPDAAALKSIAQYVVNMGALVDVYKANVKQLDVLNKELDKAASKGGNADKTDAKQLKQMQAIVPRIIKGPQVAAYAYATSASTAALQFCMAAIRAHKGADAPAEKEAA